MRDRRAGDRRRRYLGSGAHRVGAVSSEPWLTITWSVLAAGALLLQIWTQLNDRGR